jgi:predicted ATP-grasp superfamily ATP-dependent carboligase
LVIVACYLDRQSNWVTGFNTQKLVQSPEGFGTGYIVQTAHRPELLDPTRRLLQTMGFTGIAEVEYKWNAAKSAFQLIEVNPRSWDQHRLGNACGVDLIYLAYCERAGLEVPSPPKQDGTPTYKWVAEDALVMECARLLWRRDTKLLFLFRSLRGKRIYGIWWWKDPLPSFVYAVRRFIPSLAVNIIRFLWAAGNRRLTGGITRCSRGALQQGRLVEGKDERC